MTSNEGLESIAIGRLTVGHVGGLVRIDTGPALPNGEHAGRVQGQLESVEHSRDYDGDTETEVTLSLYEDRQQTIRVTFPSMHQVHFPTLK